jgi:hypothetical protein
MSPQPFPLRRSVPISRQPAKPSTFDLTAITGIITAVTVLAFAQSALFVVGVSIGLGLELTVYMQPWDYVVITPAWIWAVFLILPVPIAYSYLPDLFIMYDAAAAALFKAGKQLRNGFWGKFRLWYGYAIWVLLLLIIFATVGRILSAVAAQQAPSPPLRIWHFLAAFGPPLLSFRFFMWLFPKLYRPALMIYKNLVFSIVATLLIAAPFFGFFYFADLAVNYDVLTRITLRAEVGERGAIPYNRMVIGTILFRLTDSLLVLSPKGNAKILQPRSLIVIPLSEVRLVEATH